MRLEQRGETVTRFRSQKTAELLAYLACYSERAHPRDVLVELLWPDHPADSGRHSLSVALSSLRAILEPAGVVPDGAVVRADRLSIGLSRSAITTDVAEMESLYRAAGGSASESERARLLAAAAELYKGEFLTGFYGDWVFPEQQRYEELYLQVLRLLMAHAEAAGDVHSALQHALRFASVDPTHHVIRRDIARLFSAAGRPEAARRRNLDLDRILKAEHDDSDLRPGPSGSEPRRPDRDLRTQNPERVGLALIRSESLEPIGGAVPLGSRFYVERTTDAEFLTAIERNDAVVLVKGSRQVGKTSLLARGLQQARASGFCVALTHLQTLNAAHFGSADALLQAFAQSIAEQLDLDYQPARTWDPELGASPNLRRFMRREVLSAASSRLIWGLDEVDRIFAYPFASEVLGLFRAWHDERALDPGGPWNRLSLVMAYSTEAYLFITDLNQSPFNVGTRLALADFTPAQVTYLNDVYGSPLRSQKEIDRFIAIVGGQPYLVRRGLHEMALHGTDLRTLESRAANDEWIFGDHLRRIAALLAGDPSLAAAAREVVTQRKCSSQDAFHRLRSAGVLSGDSYRTVRPRCGLYAAYIAERFS